MSKRLQADVATYEEFVDHIRKIIAVDVTVALAGVGGIVAGLSYHNNTVTFGSAVILYAAVGHHIYTNYKAFRELTSD